MLDRLWEAGGEFSPEKLFPTLPLAHGELSEKDALELRDLKRLIQERLGVFCEGYKEPCLRRRIAVRMRARGLHTYSDYGALLHSDPLEFDKLLDAVTINVSKFFRNNEIWDVLKARVFPKLFESNAPRVRIWSAGCAAGEEPYTVAMVLREFAEEHGLQKELRRFDILGTDLDKGSLDQAARGEYGAFAFGETSAERRERFFDGNVVKPVIRGMVRLEQLDLMRDAYPDHRHMILCRNVIIYFERVVQEQLFVKFHKALSREGILVLGKVETIFGAGAPLFRPIASRERIFARS